MRLSALLLLAAARSCEASHGLNASAALSPPLPPPFPSSPPAPLLPGQMPGTLALRAELVPAGCSSSRVVMKSGGAWHGFPFCELKEAHGATQSAFCMPDHFCARCSSSWADCNSACTDTPGVAAIGVDGDGAYMCHSEPTVMLTLLSPATEESFYYEWDLATFYRRRLAETAANGTRSVLMVLSPDAEDHATAPAFNVTLTLTTAAGRSVEATRVIESSVAGPTTSVRLMDLPCDLLSVTASAAACSHPADGPAALRCDFAQARQLLELPRCEGSRPLAPLQAAPAAAVVAVEAAPPVAVPLGAPAPSPVEVHATPQPSESLPLTSPVQAQHLAPHAAAEADSLPPNYRGGLRVLLRAAALLLLLLGAMSLIARILRRRRSAQGALSLEASAKNELSAEDSSSALLVSG